MYIYIYYIFYILHKIYARNLIQGLMFTRARRASRMRVVPGGFGMYCCWAGVAVRVVGRQMFWVSRPMSEVK